MTALVALFTLRLNDLQAKVHDKKAPVLIMGNVRYRIKVT
jgi:PHD/YefM family antitoxin component YafN of YafNO toxin-antitoxin module